MPGYGYASAPKTQVASWTKLIHQFLQGRATLARVYVLIDARHGIKDVDQDVLKTLDKSAVSYQVVLTKADQVKKAELEKNIDRNHCGARQAPRRVSGSAGDILALRRRHAGIARRDGAPVARARLMSRTGRILIVLAAIMGADGVMLAAASAHGADASRLASASSMLLFHASAVLGAVALAERGDRTRENWHRGGFRLRDRGKPVRRRPDAAAICRTWVVSDGRADRRDVADRELAGAGGSGGLAAAGVTAFFPFSPCGRGGQETANTKSPTLRPARQSDRTRPDIRNGETRFMTSAQNISPLDQARILSEALPHMQQYDEETIVIKYGGHAMGAEETAKAFARDIVLLEQTAINPVVVHGGGPQIATMLKRLGIQSEFAAGLRITDAATIEIVEMVLAGSVNKQLVGYINEAGGKAVGLRGKDGNMVKASKTTRTMVDPDSNIEKAIDLGFVGDPDKVDLTLLNQLIGYELIPVLAPLATSHDGQTLNVNADTFAGAVAGALKAKRLLLLTDVPGVLDKSKKLIPELSVKDARKLIADGTISGGMIPKVETCIYALEQGVQGVVIIDGKTQHAVLLELFTNQGTGTLIHK